MNKEQAKRFGQWLRQRRQEAGMTTTELARQVGTTDGTITRFEQGAFNAPAPDKLTRIAHALDLSLADVYAMAGYVVTDDLPSFQPYLRRKYRDLPGPAVKELERSFNKIVKRYGYEPGGPKNGEDELPDVGSINN